MKKGDEYNLLIEQVEFPGTGVAFYEGHKIYVKNTVPGQEVKARITKKKRSLIEAKVLSIIKDVDYAAPPACAHFGTCGGCTHQFVPYEKQLELKKEQVLKLLDHADVIPEEFLGIIGSPDVYEYRNKMEFSFGDFVKDGELTLGMHCKGASFSIVTAEDCRIVDEDYRSILKSTLDYFIKKGLPYYKVMKHEGYLRNLIIRKGRNSQEILINLVTTSQIAFNLVEYVDILKNINYSGKLTGIIHTINDSLSDAVKADSTEVLYGRDYIYENILGLKFKISPFSFFQTNSKGAEVLYSKVREFAGDAEDKIVFDLYCGTGTIGQIVAPNAKKVIGIELIPEAVEAARENAKLNNLDNCTFIAGDVSETVKTLKDKPDIIILDPPREGVLPSALKQIINFDAKELVYVSCNPKTLVNNLKELVENGYEVKKLVLVDMFPQTVHVECVVGIRRKDSL